ncbi:MAG: HEAT repeat domain-containing protein [Planctomycetota bacterium]
MATRSQPTSAGAAAEPVTIKGVQTTFQLLGNTRNEAAVDVLIPALSSPLQELREGALAAILVRRNPAGQREILRRLHTVDERCQEIFRKHRGRMTHTLRGAVLGTDRQACVNACRAALWFREFDLIPALITALENGSNPNAKVVSKTMLELVDLLYGELAQAREDGRRDPDVMRHRAIGSLERSIIRFSSHRQPQVLRAFVQLCKRDNVVLKQILKDPHHAAFSALVEVLLKSTAAGVIGLLLAFLDDPRAPSSVLSIIGRRCDLRFLEYLLRKVGHEPSTAVRKNLQRIEAVAWAKANRAVLEKLDDAAQHAAVKLMMASAVPRDQAFATVKHLLLHGKPGGRRAAAEALGEFDGAEAKTLTSQALEDENPYVQAAVVGQLRRRGVLGALPRLVEMVDSPHAVVSQAARKSLTEFSFERFLAAFDMLDEDVRRSTGSLVKKIDPITIPRLRSEMTSRVRTRRIRALAIARTIEVVKQLEEHIVELIGDDDHMVRAEAAMALGQGDSQDGVKALHEALDDSSPVVQEAAERSLRQRGAFSSHPGHHPQDT